MKRALFRVLHTCRNRCHDIRHFLVIEGENAVKDAYFLIAEGKCVLLCGFAVGTGPGVGVAVELQE